MRNFFYRNKIGKPRYGVGRLAAAVFFGVVIAIAATAASAETTSEPLHTYPLNLDPKVHEAFQHFYNLDYEGALSRFEAVRAAHPNDPMAADYLLITLIFREMYHLDLLDTTLYAHEGFLTSKRLVQEDPAARARMEQLLQQVVSECDARIKADPNDKDAYFARGYGRAMHAAYIGMVNHSFVSGLHQALQAKNDNEKVLQLDPQYTDAKMVVGIQMFAVASLPTGLRILCGMAGIGGSKAKGLEYLEDAGAHGVITSVESRTTISLFLRHDGRYEEAIVVAHGLSVEYPHDFLFRLEEANLMKDAGKGMAAVEEYRKVIAEGKKPGYFVDPRLQLAYFGFAEGLRGQNDVAGAAEAYMQAAAQPSCSDWMRRRAELNAGEMYDLMKQRGKAVEEYQLAGNGGEDPGLQELARKYVESAYMGR
jgi:tetratricopeptide (TPR) repeat protein